MARGPRYSLPFRRRREGRTRYSRRRGLVMAGLPRLIVRPSNKHLTAQVIEAKPEGDYVLASAHSSELKKFGWNAPCGNLPSAYLAGLLLGIRAKAAGISSMVLDIGAYSMHARSRIFAAVLGALKAGVTVPHDEAVLPPIDRIQGKHVADYARLLSGDPDKYKTTFSDYIKRKLKPEDLTTHFTETESKLRSSLAEKSAIDSDHNTVRKV